MTKQIAYYEILPFIEQVIVNEHINNNLIYEGRDSFCTSFGSLSSTNPVHIINYKIQRCNNSVMEIMGLPSGYEKSDAMFNGCIEIDIWNNSGKNKVNFIVFSKKQTLSIIFLTVKDSFLKGENIFDGNEAFLMETYGPITTPEDLAHFLRDYLSPFYIKIYQAFARENVYEQMHAIGELIELIKDSPISLVQLFDSSQELRSLIH